MPIKDNFWFDIGKPAYYLIAQWAYLDYYKVKTYEKAIGNVLIHETSIVEDDCKIGPNVIIGPGCRIGKGSRIN